MAASGQPGDIIPQHFLCLRRRHEMQIHRYADTQIRRREGGGDRWDVWQPIGDEVEI